MTKPDKPTDYTPVTDERVKKVHDRISDLCHKRREWLPLRVPADREWDNDLLFGGIIRDLIYERDCAKIGVEP